MFFFLYFIKIQLFITYKMQESISYKRVSAIRCNFIKLAEFGLYN